MLPPGTLESFGLYLVRTSVLVLFAPLFGIDAAFTGARIALIAVLSLTVYAAVGHPLAHPISPMEWGVFAARESLIGLALAFVMQGVALAIRVAGELVGQEMGFNMASLLDPVSGISTPLVPQLYEGLFILGLLSLDGHHLIVRALIDSFAKAPVAQLASIKSTAALAELMVREMFTAGVVFALPVLVLMTVCSILLALLARAVPSLNMMDVGYTLRIFVGLLAMYAFAPLFAPAIEQCYRTLSFGLERVLETVGG